MIPAAAVSDVPAWLTAVLVGVTALGAVANALSGIVGGIFQIRRLEQLDKDRMQREIVQHQEVLEAINQQGETR